MSAQSKHRDLSLHDIHRLAELGLIGPEERIELIAGEIVQMAAVGGDHVECVLLFTDALSAIREKSWFVSVQNAVQLAEGYAPQPDIALIRRRVYHGELPTPADIFLIIEVSDTTLHYDRYTKLPLYAAAGIPEVWIADVKRQMITRYSDPDSEDYRVVRAFGRGEVITSAALPAISLPVDAVFGPALTAP